MTISAVCVTTTRFPVSRFTGKERDSESGNDYFGARYFGSNMGRFLSPDPLVIQALRKRRVAPVSVTVSYHAEGAPGPSPLGTGDGGRLPRVSSDAAD
jgi:RHS repeat-associated protein